MFGIFSNKKSDMWLLVGLGNPGDKYARNRHNVGFMAVDAIADEYGFPPFRKKFHGLLAEGNIGGEKVALLKPQTMMNNSGASVVQAAKFFKIPAERVVVFYDELDLPPGKVRVKQGGGAAGHNGIRSIDNHIDNNFHRVRIGIGHPGDKARVHGYVLSDFAKAEEPLFGDLLPVIAKHAPLLLENKESNFMGKVAAETKP